MRRFVFDGDVVSFSEENAAVIGVVRRDEINSMVRQGAIVRVCLSDSIVAIRCTDLDK